VNTRRISLCLVAIALLVCSACGLEAQPAPQLDVYGGRPVGYAAVDEFFANAGPFTLSTAHCIAERESHHIPTSDNGTHHGLFQLANQFIGSLNAAAQTLGQVPNWHSARQNALAARIIYNQSGWRPWGGGCR
jgi:hypothetical protein